VHRLGGYRAQGKTDASAQALREDAHALAAAGIDLLVLEMVPAAVAGEITDQLSVPTIGIGAGPGCSGQVLVLYDMLGIYPGKPARFVRNFMTGNGDIGAALAAYVRAVKDGSFPGPEHCI
jgi:3-methyl-2-oxobutanoate hydroxymethyltransferase